MEYLSVHEIAEPKINEIVAVKLIDIEGVRISDSDIDSFMHDNNESWYELSEFQHGFYLSDAAMDVALSERSSYFDGHGNLADCVTLLKYMGNGKFVELYTGVEINYGVNKANKKSFSAFAGKYNFYDKYYGNFPDWMRFMEAFRFLVASPLYVESWSPLTANVQLRIGSLGQVTNQKLIAEVINLAYNCAVQDLNLGLKTIMLQDIDYAYGENVIRDFVNRTENTKNANLKLVKKK